MQTPPIALNQFSAQILEIIVYRLIAIAVDDSNSNQNDNHHTLLKFSALSSQEMVAVNRTYCNIMFSILLSQGSLLVCEDNN